MMTVMQELAHTYTVLQAYNAVKNTSARSQRQALA